MTIKVGVLGCQRSHGCKPPVDAINEHSQILELVAAIDLGDDSSDLLVI